jgi:hypothetical protein
MEKKMVRVNSVIHYPVIGLTKDIISKSVDTWFPLFGVGNELRDMILLRRKDILLQKAVDAAFFGCLHCGWMGHKAICPRCDNSDIYYFDGVWKGTMARIVIGINDDNVTIFKVE